MFVSKLFGHFTDNGRIILSLLLPIFAWAAHLFGSYAFTEWRCLAKTHGSTLNQPYLFALLASLSLLACLVGILLAFKVLQQQPKPESVALFFVYAAIILNTYLLVTVLVQSLPLILVPLC